MLRLLLLLALSLGALAAAAEPVPPSDRGAAPGGSAGFAVVSAPHVQVLFDDPALEPYAQRVAAHAEAELQRVAALFRRAPFPVTLRLDAKVDAFNAFALPLPRPQVIVRAVTPEGVVIGHGGDLLARLLRHELTHLVQLTDTRLPEGAVPPPALGLVGEGTAVLPPAWFLEGVAVWVEAQAGDGGRLDAPRTAAVLWTLAADDALPSLADASLISYAPWPGGETRYLVGGAFVGALVDRHGWPAILDTLRVFQAGGRLRSFASAWHEAVGTRLTEEWDDWWGSVAAQAAAQAWADRPPRLTDSGGRTGAAALSPDGTRLAWRDDQGVWLAALGDGGLEGARLLRRQVAPEAIGWLDDATLVWSAVARDPGARPMDLFALDLNSLQLRRLTHGAHAHLPRGDGTGCLLYVTDSVTDGSAVMRWCEAGTVPVWRAGVGAHLVGLAPGPEGRVALSLAREGDAAVTLHLLTPAGAQPVAAARSLGNVLDPVWDGPDALLVSGDASGLHQVYRVPLAGDPAVAAGGNDRSGGSAPAWRQLPRPGAAPAATVPIVALSRALGGAEQPLATPHGVLARSLSGTGYDLVWLGDGAAREGGVTPRAAVAGWAAGTRAGTPVDSRAGTPVAGPGPERLPVLEPAPPLPSQPYPVTPYTPWPSLLPYGWLPSGGRLDVAPFGAGLEVRVPALDQSGRHALDLHVGYDTGLAGPLAGGYGSLRYGWNMPTLIPELGAPAPLGAALQVGAWPHDAHLWPVSEVAFGVRADVLLRAPVGRYAGSLVGRVDLIEAASLPGWSVEARLDAALNGLRADRFGVASGGAAFAARGRWTATAAGPSAGAWGEARWLPSLAGVPWTLGLRAGYRPPPAVPVALADWAAMGSLGTRWSVPLEWRWEDGLVALERVELEPTLRIWGGVGAPFGVGADVALWADTVVDYDGLLRLGVRAGYADGWWAALAFGWPY